MELSKEILEEVFQITRKVNRGEVTLSKAKEELVRAWGINPNSASMTVCSLRDMLNGKTYRRALTM